jgi:hypothetical protein
MHRLRNKAEAEGWRLLRVLLLRLRAVPANSGSALRRTGCSLLLCLTGDDQRADQNLARLAREYAHQFAGVVAPSRSHSCGSVCSCICSRRDLDHRPHLGGHSVHFLNARRCNRTHCGYTGPYYLTMIVPVLVLAIVSAGIYEWMFLGVFIVSGSGLIWWATERIWGKFS